MAVRSPSTTAAELAYTGSGTVPMVSGALTLVIVGAAIVKLTNRKRKHA